MGAGKKEGRKETDRQPEAEREGEIERPGNEDARGFVGDPGKTVLFFVQASARSCLFFVVGLCSRFVVAKE